MVTPFTHFLVAVASLATFYGVVATPASARADDMSAVAHVPAELLRWHSGLTGTGDSLFKPEWKSTLTAIDPENTRKSARNPAGTRDGSAQSARDAGQGQ